MLNLFFFFFFLLKNMEITNTQNNFLLLIFQLPPIQKHLLFQLSPQTLSVLKNKSHFVYL